MLIGDISLPIYYDDRIIFIKLLSKKNKNNKTLFEKEVSDILLRRNLNLHLRECFNYYKNGSLIRIF